MYILYYKITFLKFVAFKSLLLLGINLKTKCFYVLYILFKFKYWFKANFGTWLTLPTYLFFFTKSYFRTKFLVSIELCYSSKAKCFQLLNLKILKWLITWKFNFQILCNPIIISFIILIIRNHFQFDILHFRI